MNTENQPQHLAFIMDGNRRWAKQRGLPSVSGHRKGAETLVQVCRDAKDLGIKYVTVYAFSTENWQRSAEEVNALMDLLREYLKDGLKEIQNNKARIIFIGERNMLADDIVAQMNEIEKQTAGNDEFVLCMALSYGGRQEIVSAARRLADMVGQGKIDISDIDEKHLAECLYTKDVPDPDLVIRTGGEERVSNFLLWQIAYAELYFSEVLWPDFGRAELEKIIQNYNTRERRYGKK